MKGGSVRELIEGPLTKTDSELTVANVFQEGRWCWEKLSFELPKEVVDKILAVPMQMFGEKEDTLVWKLSQNREFSAASAYDLARNEETRPNAFSRDWLWKIDTIPKIQYFIWLCYHNSVLVRKTLADRGLTCHTTCPLCQNHEESISHLLRDCSFALKFWEDLEHGWFKLNSDGASQDNPGRVGGGGLIHNHDGKWVKGFMRNIGQATSVAAEFWALRDGLMLAAKLGINHLHVELDAQVVVNLVLSKKVINNSCAALLNDCRSDKWFGCFLVNCQKHIKYDQFTSES
nr:putative ribonuclease h protein [Quercus suber]